MPSPEVWSGKALIHPGWAVFHGTAGDHKRHRHHAVQLAIGIREPVKVWAQKPGALSASALVIAADCAHQLATGQPLMTLFYLERESKYGRALDDWCAGRAKPLNSKQARRLAALLKNPATIDDHTLAEICAVILPAPASAQPFAFSDERIARSITRLTRQLGRDPTVISASHEAGLSASRYAHLFRAHAGMPLRPYLRWLRLQQALTQIARGVNLTTAAHAAGFSDSAHLSRTFRRTFGIAPNVLLKPALEINALPR